VVGARCGGKAADERENQRGKRTNHTGVFGGKRAGGEGNWDKGGCLHPKGDSGKRGGWVAPSLEDGMFETRVSTAWMRNFEVGCGGRLWRQTL